MNKKKKKPLPDHLKIVPIATKSDNCATWNGEQMVSEFLGDIKNGSIKPTKMLIVWFSEDADGMLRPHRWFANLTKSEEVAMLVLAQHIAIDDWRGH